MPILYGFFLTPLDLWLCCEQAGYHLAVVITATTTLSNTVHYTTEGLSGQCKSPRILRTSRENHPSSHWFPQPFRQGPGNGPEQFVSQLTVHDQDLVELGLIDGSSAASLLAIAWADRGKLSMSAISPKQSPGFRTARASSPMCAMCFLGDLA
jgi:hypothetical protein